MDSCEENHPHTLYAHCKSISLLQCLNAEAVDGAALTLECIDHVNSSHCLAARVFSVGYSVANHIFKEGLEDVARLLVDEPRDTLYASTASQTPDGGLGDALDVVAKDLTMALGTALAKALTSLATSSGFAPFPRLNRDL